MTTEAREKPIASEAPPSSVDAAEAARTLLAMEPVNFATYGALEMALRCARYIIARAPARQAMTTKADELLALARKAKIPQQPGESMRDALSRRHFARLDFRAVANPSAIIALIEGYEAEIERLTRESVDKARALDMLAERSRHAETAESALAAAQKWVAELESLLQLCADELAIEIEARYRGMIDYPSVKRDRDLDMDTVNKARAALAGKDAPLSDDQRLSQPE